MRLALPHRGPTPRADPPDPWERPATPRELSPVQGRDRRQPNPYRARAADDLPPGALEALVAACGALPPDAVFVVPPATRPTTGDGRAWVANGWLALGVGPLAVGLWSDAAGDGPAGIRARLAFDEIAAVEDERILLYGRLTIHGPGSGLRVRYSTVARHGLESLVDVVRREASRTSPAPRLPVVPRVEGSPGEASAAKWVRLAASATVLLEEAAPAIVVHGRTAVGAAGAGGPALVAVTEREVVVAREPAADLLRNGYGVDVLALPRRALEAIEGRGTEIAVRSRGRLFTVELEPGFADRVRAELAAAIAAGQSL